MAAAESARSAKDRCLSLAHGLSIYCSSLCWLHRRPCPKPQLRSEAAQRAIVACDRTSLRNCALTSRGTALRCLASGLRGGSEPGCGFKAPGATPERPASPIEAGFAPNPTGGMAGGGGGGSAAAPTLLSRLLDWVKGRATWVLAKGLGAALGGLA